MFGIDAMTPADPRRGLRSRFLRGLGLTLVVTAAAWLAAPSLSRADSTGYTDYAFSNGSAVLAGTPYSITGLFTVGFGEEHFAQIQLTGPGPFAGLYGCGSCPGNPIGSNGDLAVAGPLQIRFSGNSLASVEITTGSTAVTDAAPTGVRVPTGTPLDYVFSNASTVLDGVPISIIGSFIFDPLTDIQYGAQFSLRGPYPWTGECYYDDEQSLGNVIGAYCPGGGSMGFYFANDLSFSPDPLARVVTIGGLALFDFAPTGVAAPNGVVVPEPTSLRLLGVALGLLFLSPRTIRRHNPNQPEGA